MINLGISCPRCGCRDFRDAIGRPWDVTKVVKLPGSIRRYRICRYCGKRVRTAEIIDKIDK